MQFLTLENPVIIICITRFSIKISFCWKSVFLCLVLFSQKKAIISLNNINRLFS
jgi:hypothetical protein